MMGGQVGELEATPLPRTRKRLQGCDPETDV
jgi:hypothetical protein